LIYLQGFWPRRSGPQDLDMGGGFVGNEWEVGKIAKKDGNITGKFE